MLVELKRFTDARNAFVRAVEADPLPRGAHYNLSFTLSNLGDYEGALRATKRALELDPYYVAQKFALAIDLQFESNTIGIAPEISADVPTETLGREFLLRPAFARQHLPGARAAADRATARAPARETRWRSPATMSSKGLMELAAAEATRAVQRGADRAEAAVLLGDTFAKRGLHGEALERYRRPAPRTGTAGRAARARCGLCWRSAGSAESRALAEELVTLVPDDVDALVAVAKGRAAAGDASGALTALRRAQVRAPGPGRPPQAAGGRRPQGRGPERRPCGL